MLSIARLFQGSMRLTWTRLLGSSQKKKNSRFWISVRYKRHIISSSQPTDIRPSFEGEVPPGVNIGVECETHNGAPLVSGTGRLLALIFMSPSCRSPSIATPARSAGCLPRAEFHGAPRSGAIDPLLRQPRGTNVSYMIFRKSLVRPKTTQMARPGVTPKV